MDKINSLSSPAPNPESSGLQKVATPNNRTSTVQNIVEILNKQLGIIVKHKKLIDTEEGVCN